MDSEDELFEESPSYRGVPATIVLINVFDPSSFKTAHKACVSTCGMIRQYLRQSTSQCVGVCLFGTEEADNNSKLAVKSVVDVFPLEPPTLDDFKKLQNTNMSTVKQAKELVMSEALLHCNKKFINCKKLLSTRTIIILSRLDVPPVQADQGPALKVVEDLVNANVNLQLVNIGETEYQIDQFYKDFTLEANKGRDVILPAPMWCEREIEKLMYQHSHRHLAVAKISFEIGNGLNIGVGIYSLITAQGQTRHKMSFLDRDTNTVLTSVTKTVKVSTANISEMDVDEDESETSNQVPLLKSELLYSQEYGGERVEFTADEKKVMENPFGPPMLKLLGFKPAKQLCKEIWYLKRAYFLFPNESIIEGSTVAFRALHQACEETGMVAICVMCTRVNAKPINVALAPCTKPLGLDVDIGFDVICIPFVENVRDIPTFDDAEETDISTAEKNILKKTIKSIEFSYTPEMFENPKLQSEYRAIEAIAFDEQEMEPFIDTTKHNIEKFQDINEELFYEIFGPFGVAPSKRAAAANDSASIKKIKYEEIDESMLKSRIANQQVNKYTVAELKNILRFKEIPGLPSLNNAKKADLVDLVLKHF